MNTVMLSKQQTLETEQRDKPRAERGEVIVEVAYCGVCRTDRKSWRVGQRDLHMPRVLGHEFSGVVVDVGKGVTDYQIGDDVAVYPGIGCGKCPDCLSGNDQRCREMRIIGFHSDGGFSRYCRIPAGGVERGILFSLPQGVSPVAAAMCEPLGCAVHMLDTFDFEKIASVWISGGGVLGFMTASLCRYYGVNTVIITEPNAMKRDLCRKAGFIAVPPEDIEGCLREHCGGLVDAAIPCCPHGECFGEGLQYLKNGGCFGFFSGLTGVSVIPADVVNCLHYKEITLKGAYGCGKKDFAAALKLLESGFDLSQIPLTMIPLADVGSVLKQEETADAVLTMIKYQ